MADELQKPEDGGAPPPEGGEDYIPEDVEAMGGDEAESGVVEGADEPYGAQVLRRIHKDQSILMQDYEEMLEHLEQPDVKKHVLELQEEIEQRMQKIEDLFSSVEDYKDLPMIEGALSPDSYESKEMEPEEDEALEVDSGGDGEGEPEEEYEFAEGEEEPLDAEEEFEEDEEEPTPEEALEGMSVGEGKKQLTAGQWKAMKEQASAIKEHGSFPKMNEKEDVPKAVREVKVTRGKKSVETLGDKEHVPGKEAEDGSELDIGAKGMESCGKDMSCGEKQMGEVLGAIGGLSGGDKALEDHERRALKEAHSFLDEAANTHDWGREHQMKAYHHYKTLEPMGIVGDGMKDLGIEQGHEPGKEAETGSELKEAYTATKSLLPESYYTPMPYVNVRTGEIDVSSKGLNGDGVKGGYGIENGHMPGEEAEGRSELKDAHTATKSTFPGDLEYWQEEEKEPEHEGAEATGAMPVSPHVLMRKAIGRAAKYFKDMVDVNEITEDHRKEAARHHSALSPYLMEEEETKLPGEEEEEIEEEPVDEEPPVEVGEMGEKEFSELEKETGEVDVTEGKDKKKVSTPGMAETKAVGRQSRSKPRGYEDYAEAHSKEPQIGSSAAHNVRRTRHETRKGPKKGEKATRGDFPEMEAVAKESNVETGKKSLEFDPADLEFLKKTIVSQRKAEEEAAQKIRELALRLGVR